MDVLEFLSVRLILCLLPFIATTLLTAKTDMEFWLVYIPILWSVLLSTFLPNKLKWIFRYLIPCSFRLVFEYKIDINSMWIVEWSNRYNSLMSDCLIYMDYAGVMLLITAFQRETLSILTIVMYRIDKWLFKYGHIKTFMYIIVCTVNAFVFAVLLQYLFRFFSQGYLQYINFTDFSVTIRAQSRTEDYELRELLYFERHHAGEISDCSGFPPLILYNGNIVNGIRVLSCRKMFYRVLGEDIDITCSIKIYRTKLGLIYGDEQPFYWMKNSRIIKPSGNQATYLKDDTIHYIIRSLKPEDFDKEISLWVKYTINLFTIKIKIGYFFIHLQKDLVNYVHVQNGYIMFIENLRFYTMSTSEDILVSQNIASILENIHGDITNICTKKFNGCSPFVHYLYNKTLHSHTTGLNYVHISPFKNEFIGTSLSCICETAYGKHTFFVQRNIFIENTTTYLLEDIKLPYLFVVLPTGITSLSRSKYDKLREDVFNSVSTRKGNWRYAFRFFVDDEQNFYYYMHILEKLVIFLFACDMCMAFVIMIKLYNLLFVRQIAKFILVPVYRIAIPENCQYNFGNLSRFNAIRYDIMIVYNCEEYDLVQNVFVPFFENRGLSVFMEDRDMTPGRSRTSAISEAVQSSRTFVIVGTESFLRDQWNTEFVLGDLILQIIHEHQGHHVIVIKWNNVAVPPPLSWDQKVTIVDWSDRRLLGENLTILRNRIRSVPYIGRMF